MEHFLDVAALNRERRRVRITRRVVVTVAAFFTIAVGVVLGIWSANTVGVHTFLLALVGAILTWLLKDLAKPIV